MRCYRRLLVLLELVIAVAEAEESAADAAVGEVVVALDAEPVDVGTTGDLLVVDEPRDLGADHPQLQADAAVRLPATAARLVPETDVTGHLDRRIVGVEREVQIDVDRRIHVAVGVHVGG